MAGRYDWTMMDDSTLQKYDRLMNIMSDFGFSQGDFDKYMKGYSDMEDRGLQGAYTAAQARLQEQMEPQMEAAPARAWGLYGDSGMPAKAMQRSMSDAMGRLMTEQMGIGAGSAQRKSDMYRNLAMQRLGLRGNIAQQGYNRALNVKKVPGPWQQAASAGLQIAGAATPFAASKLFGSKMPGVNINANAPDMGPREPKPLAPEGYWPGPNDWSGYNPQPMRAYGTQSWGNR